MYDVSVHPCPSVACSYARSLRGCSSTNGPTVNRQKNGSARKLVITRACQVVHILLQLVLRRILIAAILIACAPSSERVGVDHGDHGTIKLHSTTSTLSMLQPNEKVIPCRP